MTLAPAQCGFGEVDEEEGDEGVLHLVLVLSVLLDHHDHLFLLLDLLVVELSVFEGRSGRCFLPCQDTLSSECSPLLHFGPSRTQTFAQVVAESHSFPDRVELLLLLALSAVCAGHLVDILQPHLRSDSVVASRLDDTLHLTGSDPDFSFR